MKKSQCQSKFGSGARSWCRSKSRSWFWSRSWFRAESGFRSGYRSRSAMKSWRDG
jgi:hypothetical protein